MRGTHQKPHPEPAHFCCTRTQQELVSSAGFPVLGRQFDQSAQGLIRGDRGTNASAALDQDLQRGRPGDLREVVRAVQQAARVLPSPAIDQVVEVGDAVDHRTAGPLAEGDAARERCDPARGGIRKAKRAPTDNRVAVADARSVN